MKNILCYGDSNTFGSNPEVANARWPYDVRWTGRLQKLLGPEYYVIEEGLGGRTAASQDPYFPYRNGLSSIEMILETHKPLDLVILMLGTNDAKCIFPGNAHTIAASNGKLIEVIRNWALCKQMDLKILLVSPILIGEGAEHSRFDTFDEISVLRSHSFACEYKAVADRMGVSFFDAASVAHAGEDLLHLDAQSHKALAEALAVKVREIFS